MDRQTRSTWNLVISDVASAIAIDQCERTLIVKAIVKELKCGQLEGQKRHFKFTWQYLIRLLEPVSEEPENPYRTTDV